MLRRLLARWRARRAPVPLRLYTRPGCHLCSVMKDQIARARLSAPHVLEEVDIDRDPELVRRHGRSIPVLEIGGRPAFKGRMELADFERKFARRARELREGRPEGREGPGPVPGP